MSGYTAEMTELYTAEPETEPHIVIAKDKTVIVPEELRAIATQFEKNIETVTFDCPRYWDEHDLSTMRMYINFRRADGVEAANMCGTPVVDEMDVNIVHFDWTISDFATYAKGKLSFVACAKMVDGEGVLQNRWASRLCQDMEILEGIEADMGEIIMPSADIIEQILTKLETATEEAEDAADRAIAAAAAAFTSGYISDNANIDNLADGVYMYNGWASATITCSAGLPFRNRYGVWTKKTPYNTPTASARVDTVIDCQTGDVYAMYAYNGTWYKNTANSVNKAGDIMDGELRIAYDPFPRLAMVAEGAFATMEGSKSKASLQTYNVKDDPSNRRIINLYNSSGQTDIAKALELVDYKNDAIFSYNILHTGNKPSGSYTGNGEATARTIETGGIGNCCVVYGGTDQVAYLTPKGAFFQSGGVMAFTSDVSFSNGVITLRNAYIINTNGITYNYQVL